MLRTPSSVLDDIEKSRLPPTPPEDLNSNHQPILLSKVDGILSPRLHSNHRMDHRDVKETHVGSPPQRSTRMYDSPPYRSNASMFIPLESSSTPLSTILISLLDSVRSYLTSSNSSLPTTNSFNSPSFRLASPNLLGSSSVNLPSFASLRFAALCALWYTTSALSSNTGKAIMATFRYPVTLTWIQFGFVAAWCATFLALRSIMAGQSATSGIRKASRHALRGTLIMSFFQIAGHVFSSMAIARVPVSTVHTIKALSPLFTVASYAILFKVRYSPATYSSLLPLTVGVMLACSFDFRGNGFGFLCALGSTIVFVSQNIFSKKVGFSFRLSNIPTLTFVS